MEALTMYIEERFEPELALFLRLRESVTIFFATESVIPEQLWTLVNLVMALLGVLGKRARILWELRWVLLPLLLVFVGFLSSSSTPLPRTLSVPTGTPVQNSPAPPKKH
ncbi:uncharacterized protein PAC_06579 [Phialocephala subalpina]|uniref:Uncharacterized protein n=1 Tax=Phialocephala subalpina TaxID=576137 RepID=A0A1L7WV86_9HELO|nr:uncharacterized protein PAC_06579 [Phialocephala subalpina]